MVTIPYWTYPFLSKSPTHKYDNTPDFIVLKKRNKVNIQSILNYYLEIKLIITIIRS